MTERLHLSSVQRILIIRFSSIGDIVLTSPVVRLLRSKYPTADIRFVTKKQYADLVVPNPNLNGTFLLDEDLKSLSAELQAFKPDLVVDLHHNLRTRILKSQVGGEWRSFHKLNIEKWIRVNLKLDRLPDKHIVDRYLHTLKDFGIEEDGQGLDFFFPEAFDKPELPKELQNGFIAVVVGAKYNTKQLPENKLVELCHAIDRPILLIGGPEDRAIGKAVSGRAECDIINGCGTYSLLESAWFIKQADLVITHDTGMMHIAAAFNKKTVSVWGNTIPEFGMYPYLPQGGDSYISEVEGLKCRPCSKIGFDKCPKGHFKCMEQQDIELIILKANDLLTG